MYFSQNHNISVINIKNGRVYQEFISFFMSPCDLMALLKKTVWRQDWLCIKSLYLSIVQHIIAGIFLQLWSHKVSHSLVSKECCVLNPACCTSSIFFLCTEPSFCCKFNIPLQLFTKPSFSYKLQTQFISYQLTIGQSWYYLQ